MTKPVILNLTQHQATPDQVAEGVVDLPPADRAELSILLTFDEPPTGETLDERADLVAELADRWFRANRDQTTSRTAMIGGAPYFTGPLERALGRLSVRHVYAFSKRVCAEEPQPDGTVKKTFTFKHAGWVC